MALRPQKPTTTYYGAQVVRRSEGCSNTVRKTGKVKICDDANDPARSTIEICNLSEMYPPFHTEAEARKDNMLIPLRDVTVFAKHYNANIMYWTLFGLDAKKDAIDLKVSCISSDYPMTDFALGIVPSVYRHTKEPYIATCPGSVFMSSAGFLECTKNGTTPISPLYVHPSTEKILQSLRFCNEDNSPDLRVERNGRIYSFVANQTVLYRVQAPFNSQDYDVFVDMRCERIQGMWASKPPLVNVNWDDVLRHNSESNTVSVRSEGNSTAARECLMLAKANDYARKKMGRIDLVPRIIGAGVFNYVEGVLCGTSRSPGRQHVLVTEFVRDSMAAYTVSLREPWMWRCLIFELVECMKLFVGSKMVHNDFYARNLLLRVNRSRRWLKCTVIDFEKATNENDTATLLFNNYCCLVGMVVNLVYRNWKYERIQPILCTLLNIVGHGLLLMYETEKKDIVPNWVYLKEWGQDTRKRGQSMDDYFRTKLQGTNITVRRRIFRGANRTFLLQILVRLHHFATTIPYS